MGLVTSNDPREARRRRRHALKHALTLAHPPAKPILTRPDDRAGPRPTPQPSNEQRREGFHHRDGGGGMVRHPHDRGLTPAQERTANYLRRVYEEEGSYRTPEEARRAAALAADPGIASKIAGKVGLATSQLARAGIEAGPGAIEAGRMVGADAAAAGAVLGKATHEELLPRIGVHGEERDIFHHARYRDALFPRTRALGSAMAEQTKEDVLHPGDRPGYLLLDALAAASLGAGAVDRVAAGGRAAGEASRAAELAVKPDRAIRPGARGVLDEWHNDIHGANPDFTQSIVGGGLEMNLRALVGAERHKTRAGLAAFLKTIVKRPPPRTYPLTRRTDQGTETVNRLLSQNPLIRHLVQVPRNKRLQRAIDAPGRQPQLLSEDGFITGPLRERLPRVTRVTDRAAKAVAGHWSAESTFGREIRRGRAVSRDVAMAPHAELRVARGGHLDEAPGLERLPRRLRRGITRHENKALQALSIFGDRALEAPERVAREAIHLHNEAAVKAAQEAASHEAQLDALRSAYSEALNSGHDEDAARLHEQISREHELLRRANEQAGRHAHQLNEWPGIVEPLKRLREHLWTGEGASRSFAEAARLVAELSNRRTAMLQAEGLVKPESIAWRERGPAAMYQHAAQTGELGRQINTVEHALAQEDNPRVRESLQAMLDHYQGELEHLGADPLHDQVPDVLVHSENPQARKVYGAIKLLDKEIATLQEQFRRSAKRMRSRTTEEAAARLEALERQRESLLKRVEERRMSAPITAEAVQARLAEIDQRRAAAEARVHAANAGIEKLNADRQAGRGHEELALEHGATSQSGAMTGVTYGSKYAGEIAVAERELRKLAAERSRLEKALKTGRLRFVHDPGETIRRNKLRENGIEAPTLAEELRRGVVGEIEAMIARNPDHPVFKGYKRIDEEIGRLKEGMQKAHPTFGEGLAADEASHFFGTVPVGRDATLTARIGARLEHRQALEEALGRAERNGVRTTVVRDTTVPVRRELDEVPGAFRTPLGSPEGSGAGEPFAAPQVGKRGIAPPQPSRRDSTITHSFEGGTVRAGDLTADTAGATLSSYYKAVQIVSTLDLYRRLWRLSSATRDNEFMVPIRSPRDVPPELRRMFERADSGLPLTQEDLNALTNDQLEHLYEYLHPQDLLEPGRRETTPLYKRKVNVPLGWADPNGGIRWVDRRYIADLGDIATPGKFVKAFDYVNNPVRFLAIYARGAYILNLPGNLGMQVMTQGWMAPEMYARAFSLEKTYGKRASSTIHELVGEGKARSYSVGTGPMTRTNDALAHFWSSFIDRQSRVSSFLYWAKREGVDLNDAQSMHDFLFDGRFERQRVAAARRANKDLVEFNNLTPVERNTLRHLIFVYPWVSRATVWAGRTLLEHPHKTWTLSKLAQVAEQRQGREIGPLPGYLKMRGYYGWKHDGHKYLIGTAPLNTFQTASENGRLLGSLLVGGMSDHPRQGVSPALDLMVGLLTGQNSQGRAYKGGGIVGAAKDVALGLPQISAIQRGLFGKGLARDVTRIMGKNPDLSRTPLEKQPVFQGVSPAEGAGPLMIGQVYPREENDAVRAARVRAERLAAMPTDRRAAARWQEKSTDWLQAARRAGLYSSDEGWDEGMRQAIATLTRREVGYAREGKRLGVPSNRLNQHDRLRVDLSLMVELGFMPRSEAAAQERLYKELGPDLVKTYRQSLAHDYFGSDVVRSFKRTMKDVGSPVK